jgi:uncharacterized membrane protein YhiD involved in acid resistance
MATLGVLFGAGFYRRALIAAVATAQALAALSMSDAVGGGCPVRIRTSIDGVRVRD